MDEQALNDAFAIFSEKGYGGSIEDFKTLISTNEDALNDAHSLFSEKGYKGDVNAFSSLVGADLQKKKEDAEPVSVRQDQNLDLPSSTEIPPISSGITEVSSSSPIEKQDEAARQIQKEYEDKGITDYSILPEDIEQRVKSNDEDLQRQPQDYKDSIPWYTDLKNQFLSGAVERLAGAAGLKNYIAKFASTAILSAEELAALNSLPEDVREQVLAASSGADFGLDKNLIEAQNYLTDKSDEIRERTIQYNGNIIDDFAEGNIGQASYRVLQGAANSLSSLIAAMLPGGLVALGATVASQKQEREEREGADVDVKTLLNSTVAGVAEFFFERYTAGLLRPVGQILKGNKKLTKEFTENLGKKVLLGIGIEASSEMATEATTELGDAFIQGKDVSITQAVKNIADAGIIGGFMGGGITSTGGLAGYVANKRMPKDKKTTVTNNQKQVGKLSMELEGLTNKETKKAIISKLNSLKKESANIIKKEVADAKKMTDNEVVELVKVDREITDLIDQQKVIQSDEKITEDTKNILLEDADKKYDKLTKKKQEVLEGQGAKEVPAKEKGEKKVAKKEVKEKDVTPVTTKKKPPAKKKTPTKKETPTPEISKQEEGIRSSIKKLDLLMKEADTKLSLSEAFELNNKILGKVINNPKLNAEEDALFEYRDNIIKKLDQLSKHPKKEGKTTGKKKTALEKVEEINKHLKDIEAQLKDFGDQNLSSGLPVVVTKVVVAAFIKVMTLVEKAMRKNKMLYHKNIVLGRDRDIPELDLPQNGEMEVDMVVAGIKALKKTDWYKEQTEEGKRAAEMEVSDMVYRKEPPTKAETIVKDTQKAVENKLENKEKEKDIIKSFKTKKERMIAKDYLIRKKPVSGEEAIKIVDASYDKSQKEMKDTKQTTKLFTRFLRKTALRWWDRQYLPKATLMKADGKVVRNYMITAKGATGYAKDIYDKAYKKIYKGLPHKDLPTLEKILFQKRFLAIDKNRRERDLPSIIHADFQNETVSLAYLAEIKKQLGDDKYNDLTKRAEAYFDTFKLLLNNMEESGIITKDTKESFFEVDYLPKTYLKYLKKSEEEIPVLSSGSRESDLAFPQMKALEAGSSESLMTDTMYLLSRSINVGTKNAAFNEAISRLSKFIKEQAEVVKKLNEKSKKSKKDINTIKYFNELVTQVKENPIIRLNKKGEPKFKYKDSDGSGLKSQVYYDGGYRRELVMKEKFYDQFNDNLKWLFSNANVREKVTLLSFVGLLKTIATGSNPAFFLTNTPRDFMFISIFSEAYGPNLIKNMINLSKDASKGVKSMKKDDKVFQNFIKHGGMMNFLHLQGKFKGTEYLAKIINKLFTRKFQDNSVALGKAVTLQKLQMYSEVGLRMGVFNRSIQNQLKELGVDNEQEIERYYGSYAKETIKDMYINATAAARNTTDFNQGGLWAKDLDALNPYFNAGIQGTRQAIEALNDRPVQTMFKMAQALVLMSPLPIALGLLFIAARRDREDEKEKDLSDTELYLKAISGVSMYDKTNYMIVFDGTRTEDGEFNYSRIAMPHFMTPFVAYANGVTTKIMKELVDDDSEDKTLENVRFAIEKNISPFEFSIPGNITKNPLINSSLTYITGTDFYREKPLSYRRGKGQVQSEGHESKQVEEFYKKIGIELGESPARLKGAAEAIITTPSTSPFVGGLYGGLETMAKDKDSVGLLKRLADNVFKSTVKRVYKQTSPFNRALNLKKVLSDDLAKIEIEEIKNKKIYTDFANQILEGTLDKKDLSEKLNALAKKSPLDVKRAVRTIKKIVENPNVSIYVSMIKYSPPKQRAVMLVRLFGDGLFNVAGEMSKENNKLARELFTNKVLTKETLFEYQKIIDQAKK